MSVSQNGHYSQRGLPILELSVYGNTGSVPFTTSLVIDTGFNGGFLFFHDTASVFGWPVTDKIGDVEMMDGARISGYWTTAYIKWCENTAQYNILVVRKTKLQNMSNHDSIQGYIGMEVLRGCEVTLGKSSVSIRSEQGG